MQKKSFPFLCTSVCISTFLKIVTLNAENVAFFPSVFSIKMLTQKFTNFDHFLKMHADMTAITIHSNKIVLKEVKGNYCFPLLEESKLWKTLKEMGIPDHLTHLLRNLCAGQEATIKNQTWNNRLVPNRKRSMSRLYIVTLLI